MISRSPAPSALALLFSVSTTSMPARGDNAVCNDSFEQGQILRKGHKLLEARDRFRTCVNSCTLQAKKEACSEWLAAVERDIPTVVLSAKDANGASIVTVTVTMDGKPLSDSLTGKSIEVNPDAHTFAFEAKGGTKIEVRVVVAEGEKDKVVAGTLAKLPPPDETPIAGTLLEKGAATEVAPFMPWKAIGLGTATIGVVGLGFGIAFGLQADKKKNDAGCDANSVCPDQASAGALRDARSAADLSTGFFIAGATLAAGGIALWIFGPSRRVQAVPVVGSNIAGVAVRGGW